MHNERTTRFIRALERLSGTSLLNGYVSLSCSETMLRLRSSCKSLTRLAVKSRGPLSPRRYIALSAAVRHERLKEVLPPLESFARRHIGPSPEERQEMLRTCGVQVLQNIISCSYFWSYLVMCVSV